MNLIFAAVACQLGAVLLLKQLALVQPAAPAIDTFLHPLFLSALVCLGAQAVAWQRVLGRHPLSWAYPLVSIIYPLSLVAGWAVFGEAVTVSRLCGSALILWGVWLMSRPAAS